MKKRTVISSHIDRDKYTAYVKNQGIEEISLFKYAKDNGFELKDDEISNEELCIMLSQCCEDGIIERVISLPNHYNRDQKTINPAKACIENKLREQGFKIITHCDWSPKFSDGRDIINKRNYLTVLCENIDKKEKEYDNLTEELEEYRNNAEMEKCRIDKELEKYNDDKRNKIDKELEETKETIIQNREKIKKQNWYISNHPFLENEYNDLKEKFDILTERYRNGKQICEQQLLDAKQNWPNDLIELENTINSKKNYIEGLNSQETELENRIKELKDEINELQPKIDLMKNQMKMFDTELDSILNKYI